VVGGAQSPPFLYVRRVHRVKHVFCLSDGHRHRYRVLCRTVLVVLIANATIQQLGLNGVERLL
jgi:hypothetical protein